MNEKSKHDFRFLQPLTVFGFNDLPSEESDPSDITSQQAVGADSCDYDGSVTVSHKGKYIH